MVFEKLIMVGAKSGSRLFVHGFRGMHGAFPSFYGNNRVVRVFRVQKDGFVKRLCHSHKKLIGEEYPFG